MMKKRLSKTLWYGTDVDSFGNPIIPSFTADPIDLDGLHVGELFLHYSDGMATLWTANESGNVVRISGGEGGVDLSPYLLVSEFNKIWEIRTDSQGTEYIFGKLPVVTQYGITMYSGDDIDIPTIAEGLPFDNRTIWFNPTTGLIEVIGGTGGGSGEGVSNFWDLSGIPSWITNTKPTYSYSEIQDTPDLSKYALVSQIPSLEGYAKLTDIPSLSGYATQAWVNQQGFLKEHQDLSGYQPLITSTNKLAYSLISGTPDLSVYALKSAIPSLNGYATESWVLGKGYATVSDLDGRINALINGAPQAYDTLKEIADVLQGNVNSIGDIITTLGNKADKATTLVGYGITDAYTKTNVDNLLKSYVTLAGTNKITTLGTITTGTWNGSKIANDYLANNKVSISGVDVSLGSGISQSALRTALGLGSNAYTSTAYLPLTGGTLSGYTETPLILKGTYSDNVLFHLHNKSNIATSVGKYGTYTFLANYANGNGTGELEIHNDGRLTYATGGNNYSIWHEGNLNPSDYLPLSGGILENTNGSPLRINSTHQGGSAIVFLHNGADKAWFGYDKNVGRTYMYNTASQSYLGVRDNGTPYFNSYTLWHNGNFNPSNYLPLAGGTIGTSSIALTINRLGALNSAIRYMIDGVEQGSLGFYKSLGLAYYDANNVGWYKVWHENNDGSESGLDADLLDGKHNGELTALYIKSQNVTTDNFSTYLNTYGNQGLSVLSNMSGADVGDIPTICAVLNIGSTATRLGRFIFMRNDQSDGLWWQSANSAYNAWGTKRKVAFVDSNVESATKLQTTRYIWGRSFNGTGNVTGDLDMGNNIIICQKDTEGNRLHSMYTSTSNNLVIGSGHASKGYSTYINGNDIYLRYGTGQTTGMLMNSFGNITIGSSDLAGTSCKLCVNGDTLVKGGLTFNSMRSLKNIQDERGLSLDELSIIKPTRFTWKDGRDDRIHIGGIADDVQKVLPEVIYNMDNVLCMDYGNAAFAISASLIKPVVNHEERIKVLEEENERLKREIEQLKWHIA